MSDVEIKMEYTRQQYQDMLINRLKRFMDFERDHGRIGQIIEKVIDDGEVVETYIVREKEQSSDE